MNNGSSFSDQPKVRCFGGSAALTVEATWLTRDAGSVATINLDVAPRQMDSVDWSRKITLQLSENELPLFAAVCLGYLPKCQFKRPGKGILIERQNSKLFLSASAEGDGNRFSLPIPIGQTFQIGCLALSQLKKQVQLDDADLIIASLRGAAALYLLN
jgi:hypothetical protein